MMRLWSAAALVPVLASAAEKAPVISEPWARASILQSRPAAAYLTMESAEGDRLIALSSPVAETIMVHAIEAADGISRMRHLPAVELKPGEPVSMAPGTMHLMLLGLTTKLVEGAEFPLTLEFEEGGEVTVLVPVLGPGASGPAGGTDE